MLDSKILLLCATLGARIVPDRDVRIRSLGSLHPICLLLMCLFSIHLCRPCHLLSYTKDRIATHSALAIL